MQKLIQKSQNELCIYKIRTKILSTENPPRPAVPHFVRLVNLRFTIKFCFTKLASVNLGLRIFSTTLLGHSFLRFFTRLGIYTLILALFEKVA